MELVVGMMRMEPRDGIIIRKCFHMEDGVWICGSASASTSAKWNRANAKIIRWGVGNGREDSKEGSVSKFVR